MASPFARSEQSVAARQAEADAFYGALLPEGSTEDHRILGEGFTVPVPCLGGKPLTLRAIANLIAQRLVGIFRRDAHGRLPLYPAQSPFQIDPHWKDLLQFHEYYHAETGQGLGAAHQTGWSGLVANLVMRRYRKDIPAFWRRHAAAKAPAPARAAGRRANTKRDE